MYVALLTQPLHKSTGTRCTPPACGTSFLTRTIVWYVARLTQTRPHEDHLAPALQRSWSECKAVFGSDHILIVSNSAGTCSDPGALAAENVSSQLGVPVLCHASKKPSRRCAQQVVDYFRELAQRGAHPDAVPHVLVIGDRLTTDVVLASRIGRLLGASVPRTDTDLDVHEDVAPRLPLCTAMLTTQLWAPEKLGTRLMRGAENSVLRALVRVGIPPRGGWRTRAAYVGPSWTHDVPDVPLAQLQPEKQPQSILIDAAARQLPPRLVAVLRGIGRAGYHLARMLHLLPVWERVKGGARTVMREVFASVQHTRELTWSAFTAAPVKPWKSTWRTPRSNVLKDAAVPPVGSLRSGTRRRAFSTCAVRRASPRSAHERPAARRAPPPPPSSPPTLFGVPLRQWLFALVAIVILPTGFIGGIKLNDWLAQWRDGDLSHEGDVPAMADFAPPPPEVDEQGATVAQLTKKIQRYVHYLTQP